MSKLKNPNHQKKGSSIKADPIRDTFAIDQIKRSLRHKPRDYCLFVMGVNTAYRMSELLSLNVRHVMYGFPGRIIDLKQPKQDAYRAVMINEEVADAFVLWLRVHPERNRPSAPLFRLEKTGQALTVGYASRMVKQWCEDTEGLSGSYSSHTLRKTWAFMQRVRFKEPILLISKALGHASVQETTAYLGLVPEEVQTLYRNCV